AAQDRGGEGDDPSALQGNVESLRIGTLEVGQRRSDIPRALVRRRDPHAPREISSGANEDSRTAQHVGRASLTIGEGGGAHRAKSTSTGVSRGILPGGAPGVTLDFVVSFLGPSLSLRRELRRPFRHSSRRALSGHHASGPARDESPQTPEPYRT